MENASLQRLFDAFPREDRDRLEAAANRYYFQRNTLGPVQATRNFFLSFLTSFPGAILWSDEEIAQGIDRAQQRLATLNATKNNMDATSAAHPSAHHEQPGTGDLSTKQSLQQPGMMGASQSSDDIPKNHYMTDTAIQPPVLQPSISPSSASQSVQPPSPVESHELVSCSPKMSQIQRQALATPSPSNSFLGTNEPTALEIPYLGRICNICDADFVWKKTAERCFLCLGNKPSHEKIADIFERAMRGIDSCSNCYGEANRGENMHCRDCHERQVLKTRRHAAKKKAMGAHQAAKTGGL